MEKRKDHEKELLREQGREIESGREKQTVRESGKERERFRMRKRSVGQRMEIV